MYFHQLKKKIIFYLIGFLIFETACSNLYFAIYITKRFENPLKFQQIVNHENQTFLSFQIPADKSQFSFKIIGNGAIAEDSLNDFCKQEKMCILPLVFGGKQTIKIYQIHVNSPNLVLFLEQIIKTLIKDKLKSLLIIE